MESPGVTFPPPLIFIGFYATGYVLERVAPIPLVVPVTLTYLGWVIVVASIVVMLFGFLEFRHAHTTILPNHGSSAFISHGIFSLTRNPLYLSLAMLYVGFALRFEVWWALVVFIALIPTIDFYVIIREEKYLEERFGDTYRTYCKRIPRWF
jgi:protein-S-isoprenylcysteine O-methyltransferase Ste14